MVTLDVFNAVLAFAIAVYVVVVADRLTRASNHFYRCALVMLGVAMLANALWPLFAEWPDWMDTFTIVAVGAYLIADRRLRAHAFKELAK